MSPLQAALARPREFVRAMHWLSGVVDALAVESDAFPFATNAYRAFAASLVAQDPIQARALFEDLTLPRLAVRLPRFAAEKVRAVVDVMFTFYNDGDAKSRAGLLAQVRCVQNLQLHSRLRLSRGDGVVKSTTLVRPWRNLALFFAQLTRYHVLLAER